MLDGRQSAGARADSALTSVSRAGTDRGRLRRDFLRSLLELTQPRMMELLLITMIPVMLVAQRGLPSARVLAATLAAGALATASTSAVSSCLSRAADAGGRPAARRSSSGAGGGAARLDLAGAMLAGLALGAAATILLGLADNWLSAVLADVTIVTGAGISALHRRGRRPSGTVIGGVAACFPVLIGWSAVTGTVSLRALVMVAVIFCWVPPWLWALAAKFRGSSALAAAAGWPAAASAADTMAMYSCIMVAATVGLAPYGGWVYTVAAGIVGGWFLAEAFRLRRRGGRAPGHFGAAGGEHLRLPGLCLACLAQLAAVSAAIVLLPRR